MTPQEAREILVLVVYPDYTFEILERNGEMFLRACYTENDINTDEPEIQKTRKWHVSKHAIKSELIQTAFKCILTSAEHRVREHFKYRGELIYGPHFSADELYGLLKKRAAEDRR